MKKLLFALVAAVMLATSPVRAADAAPKTVIHFITVAWKEGTTPEQIKAALDGAHKLPQAYKGILRVWTKPIKIQDAKGAEKKKNHIIAIEFASEQALKDYADSPAQKTWYELYTSIREVSTTFDVTN